MNSKAQEIADLSKIVARASAAVQEATDEPVRTIRPHVMVPLSHAYEHLEIARKALDAAGYAVAHAATMNADGQDREEAS